MRNEAPGDMLFAPRVIDPIQDQWDLAMLEIPQSKFENRQAFTNIAIALYLGFQVTSFTYIALSEVAAPGSVTADPLTFYKTFSLSSEATLLAALGVTGLMTARIAQLGKKLRQDIHTIESQVGSSPILHDLKPSNDLRFVISGLIAVLAPISSPSMLVQYARVMKSRSQNLARIRLVSEMLDQQDRL